MNALAVLVQLLVAGLTVGSVYALIALGFTLIYNSTGVFNFAQGEFVMLGAVLAVYFVAQLGLPFVVSLVLVGSLVALAGMLVEFLTIRPLYKRDAPVITFVMVTLAAAIVIATVARVAIGTYQMHVPTAVPNNPIRIAGVTLMPQNLFVIAAAGVAVALFWAFFNRTLLGLAIRATGISRATASLMGIKTSTMIVMTFGLSAALSAIAGLLVAPIISAYTYMGLPLSVKGFIAGTLGGITSPLASVTGGILLGMLESLVAGYISSAYVEPITFVLLIIILLVRPHGLFGELRE